MSQSITFGRQWEATVKAVTGAGTTTITGQMLECTSALNDSAKHTRYVYLQPGETLKVSAQVLKVSGVDGAAGGLKMTVGGTIVDSVKATGKRWKKYTLAYQHSHTAAEAAFVAIDFGVLAEDAGTCRFIRPTLEIGACQQGSLRAHACGLILLNGAGNGSASINSGFTSHGIRAVAYDSVTKKLTITMDKTSGASFSSPLYFVAMDNTGNGVKLIPRAGNYTAAAGTVVIQFYDVTPASGQTTPQGIVDIATYGAMYMWFKAEI